MTTKLKQQQYGLGSCCSPCRALSYDSLHCKSNGCSFACCTAFFLRRMYLTVKCLAGLRSGVQHGPGDGLAKTRRRLEARGIPSGQSQWRRPIVEYIVGRQSLVGEVFIWRASSELRRPCTAGGWSVEWLNACFVVQLGVTKMV